MSSILEEAEHHLAEGRYAIAEELCRKAMLKPKLAHGAKRMLENCLYQKGAFHFFQTGLIDQAESAFSEVLAVNPRHADVLNTMGVLKDGLGRRDEATDFYRRALAADPGHLNAMKNLVSTYLRDARLDDAAQMFARLAAAEPANAGLYSLHRALLIESIIPDADYPGRAREKMNAMLDELLRSNHRGAKLEQYVTPKFYPSYHGVPNKELHTKIARTYLHLCPSLAWEAPQVRGERPQGRRIRIGIASAYLRNHSIGHTTIGLVEKLDRSLFEVIVIHIGASKDDAMKAAIDRAADASHTVAIGDLQRMRDQIAALSLDILFYQDIGMEPYAYLLSFARLAPIQVTSFGHPDTTGVPNMDYFISSALYELPGAQDHYTEELVMLPGAGNLAYYHKPQKPAEEVLRSEFALSDAENLYLCPQTLFKFHPKMDEIFLAIAQRDPKARIVLIEVVERSMRDALEERLRRSLGAAYDRVTFSERLPHPEYLRLLSCADVMLDTVHFNGYNTNLEAFALGIPVVTWPGVMQRERHTAGMLEAMGGGLAAELAASSVEEYADIAVRIATDYAYRNALRARIVDASEILYEDAGVVRAMEQAFLRMAQRASTPVD